MNESNKSNIRWKQRFQNYEKALRKLRSAVELTHQRELSELEETGLIKAFEFTYELAWNTLKDFLQEHGQMDLYGSRDAISQAFNQGLIEDGEGWMAMYKDRNKSSHTYNEETAKNISKEIIGRYFSLFISLQKTLNRLCTK